MNAAEPVTINARLAAIADELIAAGITLPQALSAFERTMVDQALRRDRFVSRAAKSLGIHRNSVRNKLRRRER